MILLLSVSLALLAGTPPPGAPGASAAALGSPPIAAPAPGPRAPDAPIAAPHAGLFASQSAPQEAPGEALQEAPLPDTLEPVDARVADLSAEERVRLEAVQQLLAIYRRMPGLRDVRLNLTGGILEIWGTSLNGEARDAAIQQAREVVPGVAFVDATGLVVETDPRRRLAPVVDRLREQGVSFLRFVPTLILGFLVIGLGALVATWAGNRRFLYDRVARNPFARNLLRQAVRTVVFVTALLLALDLMDVTALVGAVLGAAGVAGIAIGFAFRDIVENYLAGILLSLRQPFAPNDNVRIAGEEGRVARLTGRETVLMTADGNHVRIPNATVFKSVITNMTRNPRRRFLFDVGIAPYEAVGKAISTARDAVAGVTGVLDTPPVAVRIHELQDSATALRISGWVDQSRSDFGKVRSRAIRAVKEGFEEAGIETPPPEFGIRILERAQPDEPARGLGRPAERTGVGASAETAPSPTVDASADSHPDPDLSTDVSPDTTIEDEIAREHLESDEEDLLQPNPELSWQLRGPGGRP